MTDSLATKQDLHELGLVTQHALEAHAATTKRDLEAHAAATKHELGAHAATFKLDLDALAAATKHDLGALAAAFKHDLDALEERMNARFEIVDVRLVELEKGFEARLGEGLADLERRLTMRLGGMMVAGIAVVSALVKVL